VDPKHLATPHDRTISDSDRSIEAYSAIHHVIISSSSEGSSRPLCLMQISHAGLQSSSTIGMSRWPWEAAIAPCSSRPDTGSSALGWVVGHALWPKKSRVIDTPEEWLAIAEKFVMAAKVAEKAGWEGVQVHSAHGYLLAEYLSPLVSLGNITLASTSFSQDPTSLNPCL
jgi:2,4-dienoyl-CoA reductase-like NADH-dependent reductase (Old Yellow Enzyme family)